MKRSSLVSVVIVSFASAMMGCTVDADPTPESPSPAPVVTVEASEVHVAGRCPLPKKRGTCDDWRCSPGLPGCPAVCQCWD